jgi:hypothetical protein
MGILDAVKGMLGSGNIVDSLTKAVDTFVTTDKEREALKQEMLKIQQDYDIQKGAQLADLEKSYLADTANARDMQKAALGQEDKFSKRFIYYLAAFVLISTIGFGIMLCLYPIPDANKRMVEMFFDVFLFSGALSVLYFFFGSSHGSMRKTDIMKNNNQSN